LWKRYIKIRITITKISYCQFMQAQQMDGGKKLIYKLLFLSKIYLTELSSTRKS